MYGNACEADAVTEMYNCEPEYHFPSVRFNFTFSFKHEGVAQCKGIFTLKLQ